MGELCFSVNSVLAYFLLASCIQDMRLVLVWIMPKLVAICLFYLIHQVLFLASLKTNFTIQNDEHSQLCSLYFLETSSSSSSIGKLFTSVTWFPTISVLRILTVVLCGVSVKKHEDVSLVIR